LKGVTGATSVLPRAFYTRDDVVAVARDLLGKLLVVRTRGGGRASGITSGIIVETEAYRGPEDLASHARGGLRTARTETMYAVGGTAYVYLVYGMHHMFNVVTSARDVPHAVLVRAIEPVEGVERMRKHRAGASDLARGPAKLCQALAIDRSFDGADLRGGRVWIEDAGARIARSAIASGERIGVDYAGAWSKKPWRFWLRESPFVSPR
jgi:DNA-3-methyladenine glycosylase